MTEGQYWQFTGWFHPGMRVDTQDAPIRYQDWLAREAGRLGRAGIGTRLGRRQFGANVYIALFREPWPLLEGIEAPPVWEEDGAGPGMGPAEFEGGSRGIDGALSPDIRLEGLDCEIVHRDVELRGTEFEPAMQLRRQADL